MNPHFLVKYTEDELYYLKNYQEAADFIEEILNNNQKLPISIEEFDKNGKLVLEYKVNATVRLHWTKNHESLSCEY